MDEIVSKRLRSYVGQSFAAIADEGLRHSDNSDQCWSIFYCRDLWYNLCLIYSPSQEIVDSYSRQLASRGYRGRLMLSGEATKLRPNRFFTTELALHHDKIICSYDPDYKFPPVDAIEIAAEERLPMLTDEFALFQRIESSPFMAFDLIENISSPNGTIVPDERVYIADDSHIEKLHHLLAESFELPVERSRTSLFGSAIDHIKSKSDFMEVYVIDDPDTGNMGSLVFDVRIEDCSVLLAMGTHKNSRRKGLASAILRTSLYRAHQKGLRYSLLFASPVGTYLYRSLGYKTLEYWQTFIPMPIPPK